LIFFVVVRQSDIDLIAVENFWNLFFSFIMFYHFFIPEKCCCAAIEYIAYLLPTPTKQQQPPQLPFPIVMSSLLQHEKQGA